MTETLQEASSIDANKPNTIETINSPDQEVPKIITPNDLKQFYGTSQHCKHWLKQFFCTDGAQYLAQEMKAYWLLDAIASHQTKELLSDNMLKDFQIWKLIVNQREKTAKLICEKDTNDVVITQDIAYTDFPLSKVKLYLVGGVLMLPSEY